MSLEEVRNYINSIRRDFSSKALNENDVKDCPFQQFAIWLEEAVSSQILDPYAACFSSSNAKGQVSSRIVYIRDIIDEGFVFYTNYNSKKAEDIKQNPNAAFNIHWGELERQIKIKGKVIISSTSLSDVYFSNRPRESQIGAWASKQSSDLISRDDLEKNVAYYENKFKDKKVTRPDFWGGYILLAESIEFWQGRSNRLHDRIVFKKENNIWRKSRLSP